MCCDYGSKKIYPLAVDYESEMFYSTGPQSV